MKLAKKLGLLTAASLGAVGIVLAGAGPAMASKSQCDSGDACFWIGADYDASSGITSLDRAYPEFAAGFQNDRASSLYNHTSRTWGWYSDANYGGQVLKMSSGSSYSNLQNVNRLGPFSWNDCISSAKPL